MTREERVKIVRDIVKDYAIKNLYRYGMKEITNIEDHNHVIETGTSLLCAKWEIDLAPGGFVSAMIKNDLMATYNMADSVNVKVIQFYLMLMYNVGIPKEF